MCVCRYIVKAKSLRPKIPKARLGFSLVNWHEIDNSQPLKCILAAMDGRLLSISCWVCPLYC